MGRKRSMVSSANDTALAPEPGDNTKYLQSALAVKAIGATKVDLQDYEAVRERIERYFALMIERDQKPTMTGLAMALGYDRRRVYEIVHNLPIGGLDGYQAKFYGHTTNPTPERVQELVRQAVEMMTMLWEDYMQNGKINPASGIFLGKNFYGMKDEVEHRVTASVNPVDEYSAEEITARYLANEKKK